MKNKDIFIEEIKAVAKGKRYDIDIRPVQKNNITKTGVSLILDSTAVVPTLYVEDIADYINAEEAFDILLKATEEPCIDFESLSDVDSYKVSNVRAELVNFHTNIERLRTMPYRKVSDLALTYRYYFNEESSTVITNRLAEIMNLTEADLYENAIKNGKGTGVLQPLEELLTGMGVPVFGESGLYILTNTTSQRGAAAILYPDMQEKIEELMEKNGIDRIKVIPSSIHEMLLIVNDSADNTTSFLVNMITEVNSTNVSPEERLSNNLYEYSKGGKFKVEGKSSRKLA